MDIGKNIMVSSARRGGSALILAVVLTSLLAMIGTLFFMSARVEKRSASSLADQQDLDLAIETVITRISDHLARDVPGMPKGEEYCDYPDANDPWLASLEPYYDSDSNNYNWDQVSNIFYPFPLPLYSVNIESDSDPAVDGEPADADGDGIEDSYWFIMPEMTSSKGRPIYVAVRIIDDCGMLNVNTARRFDPCSSDGSSQMQINLEALAKKDDELYMIDVNHGLPLNPSDAELDRYSREAIWAYNNSNISDYTLFDISDELMLRNRYMLKHRDILTRLQTVWPGTFDRGGSMSKLNPYDDPCDLDAWFHKVYMNPPPDLAKKAQYYTPRHITTTYNMDRVIDPNGRKMISVNAIESYDRYEIRDRIHQVLPGDPNSSVAAQITANLIDFIDADSEITVVDDNQLLPGLNVPHYGFERPCVYISELAFNVNDVNASYAIELYMPYSEDPDPCGWQLVIEGYDNNSPVDVNWTVNSQFHVIRWHDLNAPLTVPATSQNFNIVDGTWSGEQVFHTGRSVRLQRPVLINNTVQYIVVDSEQVPARLLASVDPNSHKRDITLHKCLRRLWSGSLLAPDLGNNGNPYVDADANMLQAHPADANLTNIGELGMVLSRSAYMDPNSAGLWINDGMNTEDMVRIDVSNPRYQGLFNIFTVFDPNDHGHPMYEMRIPGRININTAPWYVIAQLPWMDPDPLSPPDPNEDYRIARAIVGNRDGGGGSFNNIAELTRVAEMAAPFLEGVDLAALPDLSPGDGAADDFEERDVIFARISNLITVRSDVFTAYILVRIGEDGPQRRMIAILDRSGVQNAGDQVRIRALHPVHDPR